MSSFISHPAITLAILRSPLNLLSPILCFTPGNNDKLRATNSADVMTANAGYSLKKIYAMYTIFLTDRPGSLYCHVLYYIRSLSIDTDHIPVKQTKIRNGDTTVKHGRRLEADVKI